jgi:hypothetical protein
MNQTSIGNFIAGEQNYIVAAGLVPVDTSTPQKKLTWRHYKYA